jgi:hypothetical protein
LHSFLEHGASLSTLFKVDDVTYTAESCVSIVLLALKRFNRAAWLPYKDVMRLVAMAVWQTKVAVGWLISSCPH